MQVRGFGQLEAKATVVVEAALSQPSALAEKLPNVGQSRMSHFSSRLVRLAKFIKGT